MSSQSTTILDVQIWLREMQGEEAQHKLKYVFLANDIVLQARKKNPMFIDAFRAVLDSALTNIRDKCDASTVKQVQVASI